MVRTVADETPAPLRCARDLRGHRLTRLDVFADERRQEPARSFREFVGTHWLSAA